MSCIVRHAHYDDMLRVEACAEVFESLSAVVPRVGHHVLAVDMEPGKAKKARHAVPTPTGFQDGLNTVRPGRPPAVGRTGKSLDQLETGSGHRLARHRPTMAAPPLPRVLASEGSDVRE